MKSTYRKSKKRKGKHVGLIRRILKVRWTGQVFVSNCVTVQKLIDYLWLRKSGSKQSATNYFWHLSRFCHWTKISPDAILGKTREDLEVLVQSYLDEIRRRSVQRGSTARYANTSLACLKTFFRVNGFNRENNLELRLHGYNVPPRTRSRPEYVPTLAEACRMAERAGSIRNRAIIYTLFSTGLRNTAIRALIVKDVIKELEAEQKNLLIKVEPEWNKRIPGACKNGIPYYTFMSTQATEAIREMLKRRKEIFGFIKDDEPLFISMGSQRNRRMPLSARELQEVVKKAAREADIEKWEHVIPHSLRKVFESVLRSPMKDGDRMDVKDQEFLMGHILPGTQDPYYDWSKINKLRNEFSKLLFTEEKSPEAENLGIYKEMAELFGIDPNEIKKKKENELGRSLTLKEEKEELQASIRARLNSSCKEIKEQKIIPTNKMQGYLNNGWKFLSIVDQDHAIVERL
ncbi:MAG: tyrosine-type recombinase/integrase [Candidatus Bathyarchaeia archaeon]